MKLFFCWLLITLLGSTAFSQRGLIVSDSTIVHADKSFSSDSISCLTLGQQIHFIEGKFTDQTFKIELIADNGEHIVGWVNKDHVLCELQSQKIPMYILSDSIRLYSSPSEQERSCYVSPNRTFESGDYVYVFASTIEYLSRESGWSHIKIDSIDGWINDSLTIPACFVSMIDSTGHEIAHKALADGGNRLEVAKINDESYLMIKSYNSINLIDPVSFKTHKRYFCSSLNEVHFLYNSSSFLINQLIRNSNPPNSFTSRVFLFDPIHFSAQKIIDTTSNFWPSSQFYVSPSKKTFYFHKVVSPYQSTLIKTDDHMSVLDSLTLDDISRYHSFLNEDTMVVLIFKHGNNRVITLGFFDLNKMTLTSEQELTKHFVLPEPPYSLSLDVVYYWNRYFFLYGRYRLLGESALKEHWRTLRWNIDTDVLEEVPFPNNIVWEYTPKTINGHILTYTNYVDSNTVIQEFDLKSLRMIKTTKIEFQSRPRDHREINNKHFVVGGEGIGLYDDVIFKLSNGNYLILYSHHGD